MKSLAQAIFRCAACLFGVASLVAGLAVLSSIPVLNFLAFGYLLEAAGRTARSGRWRDGIFGQREAALLGAVAAEGWLLVLPIRFISSLWRDADLLGAAAPSIRITSTLLALLTGGLLIVIVLGLLGVGYVHGRDLPGEQRFLPAQGRTARVAGGHAAARLFTLGLLGWIGGFAWLVLPIGVFYAASRIPNNSAVLVMALGLILLVPVATSLPLVQAVAASRRFRDFFDWPGRRRFFRQAPLASLVAVLATFVAALPLYLFEDRAHAPRPRLASGALLHPPALAGQNLVGLGDLPGGTKPTAPRLDLDLARPDRLADRRTRLRSVDLDHAISLLVWNREFPGATRFFASCAIVVMQNNRTKSCSSRMFPDWNFSRWWFSPASCRLSC